MALSGIPTSPGSIVEYQQYYKRQLFRVIRGEGPVPPDLNTWADTAQVDAYNGRPPRVPLGPSPTAQADIDNYLAGYDAPSRFGGLPLENNDLPNNPLYWFTEGEIDSFAKAPRRQIVAITKYEPPTPPLTPPIYTGNTGVYYGGYQPPFGGGFGSGGVSGASLATLLALARLYGNNGSNGKKSKKKQTRRYYSY